MNYLPCIAIEPSGTVNASVIWLHGLGANGNDFASVATMIKLPDNVQVRYIFPHAPKIAVTINGGYRMPAWYDILDMSAERKIDLPGLLASSDSIQDLVRREIARGIDSSRIIIAGFSQGGAVAYQAALTFEQPLAGLLVMSSYFATHASIKRHTCNKQLPIHVYHGSVDPVVPEALGRQAKSYLQTMGYQPEYTCYPAKHTVTAAQIEDIAAYLSKLFALSS
ncbi:MAG: phospholipase/carboxylesterase [Moritella sp.]|jgi:phospholipase/carboxylesterase